MDKAKIKEVVERIVERDEHAISAITNKYAWGGYASIEDRLMFVEGRLIDTLAGLVIVMKELSSEEENA